jgi:hypothetical protein
MRFSDWFFCPFALVPKLQLLMLRISAAFAATGYSLGRKPQDFERTMNAEPQRGDRR